MADGAQMSGVVRPLRELLLSDKGRAVSGPAPPPPPTSRDELLRTLVKQGGSATSADVDVVRASLATVPTEILSLMQKRGIRVVACRDSVTDHLTHLRGVTPRGWPAGSTWDRVPGCYEPGRKEVVVGTRGNAAGQREVPHDGHGHGAASLTLHELAHALDYTNAGGHFSVRDAGFQSAYARDLARLTVDAPYLAQSPPAGPEEAFAETWAMFLVEPHELAKWPALDGWWRTLASRAWDFTRGGAP